MICRYYVCDIFICRYYICDIVIYRYYLCDIVICRYYVCDIVICTGCPVEKFREAVKKKSACPNLSYPPAPHET